MSAGVPFDETATWAIVTSKRPQFQALIATVRNKATTIRAKKAELDQLLGQIESARASGSPAAGENTLWNHILDLKEEIDELETDVRTNRQLAMTNKRAVQQAVRDLIAYRLGKRLNPPTTPPALQPFDFSGHGLTWGPIVEPEQREWWSVAYGDGVFVSVSSHMAGNPEIRRIMRSTDNGLTWNMVQSPDVVARAVAYGNGVWIAIGNGAEILRSSSAVALDNAITWQSIPIPSVSPNIWSDIAYGDGTWVAVSAQNSGARIIRSENNGFLWQTVDAPEQNQWSSVAYGGGTFVAVASFGTNRVMRSVDAGVTWQAVEAPPSTFPQRVTYGDGVFVAVSSVGSGNRVIRSEDNGVTWQAVPAAEQNQWTSVTYGDGVFVAVASSGANRVMRSVDKGLTWQSVAAARANPWISVAYGNGTFISVAWDDLGGPMIMRSTGTPNI